MEGIMPLNCDWIQICPCCQKFWCSKGKNCGSPECECTEYLTVKDFRDDLVRVETCGACIKETREWLKRNEPVQILRLTAKIQEHYHDDDEAMTMESGER
jgi:hypothetical protein